MVQSAPVDPKTYRQRQQAVRSLLIDRIEGFIKSQNDKIQVEKTSVNGCDQMNRGVPKLYEIELLKDNECVDSVNKSDKDALTNQQMHMKENSESNGRIDHEMSNSSGRGTVPNNLRSWGFERKKEDGQAGAKK